MLRIGKHKDVAPSDRATGHPQMLDRPGMYPVDIEEMRAGFRNLNARVDPLASHTFSVVEGLDRLATVTRAVGTRAEQLTSFVQELQSDIAAHRLASDSADASLVKLIDRRFSEHRALADKSVGALAAGQQEVIATLTRELSATRKQIAAIAAGSVGVAPATQVTSSPAGSPAPALSVDDVFGPLKTFTPQKPTEHGRRAWIAGRCYIVEAKLSTGMNTGQMANEMKFAIGDAKLRPKGLIGVVVSPVSLAPLHSESSWKAQAEKQVVFILDLFTVEIFVRDVNAREKGTGEAPQSVGAPVGLDLALLRSVLTGYGNSLRSAREQTPEVKTLRRNVSELLKPLLSGQEPASAPSAPASTPAVAGSEKAAATAEGDNKQQSSQSEEAPSSPSPATEPASSPNPAPAAASPTPNGEKNRNGGDRTREAAPASANKPQQNEGHGRLRARENMGRATWQTEGETATTTATTPREVST